MKDFFVLKVLDRFKFIFKTLKIDYPIMRKILQIKFIVDNRRVPMMFGNNVKNLHDKNNLFIKSLWIYSLLGGVIIIPLVFFSDSMIYQMSIIFGLILFLITSSVISDFSSVLLDIREKTIIGTKPINSRTISAAKFIHIVTYMYFLTLSIALPGILAFLIKNWVLEGFVYSFLFVLLFIIELTFLDLFIVVLTTLLYLFILKFFDGEKLKDIINYVQIITAITLVMGYQFLGRAFIFFSDSRIEFTPEWYHYLIMPLWFGSTFEMLFKPDYNPNLIIYSCLAVVVPIISFLIYLKLIPTFEANLLKLNQNQLKGKPIKKKLLGKIITRDNEERLFYRFTSQMMKSERGFKLRVYPSLGFSLIFPLIFLLNGVSSINNIASTKLYFFIYFCVYLLPAVIIMLQYSVNYKAAWIYNATPIKELGKISKAALKAFITNLILPIYIIESAVFLYLFGYQIIPDLIIIFITILVFTVISYKIVVHHLPFTESFENYDKSQGVIALLMMLLLGGFAIVHLIFTLFNYGSYIYLVILLVINLLLWKYSFNFNERS